MVFPVNSLSMVLTNQTYKNQDKHTKTKTKTKNQVNLILVTSYNVWPKYS